MTPVKDYKSIFISLSTGLAHGGAKRAHTDPIVHCSRKARTKINDTDTPFIK